MERLVRYIDVIYCRNDVALADGASLLCSTDALSLLHIRYEAVMMHGGLGGGRE